MPRRSVAQAGESAHFNRVLHEIGVDSSRYAGRLQVLRRSQLCGPPRSLQCNTSESSCAARILECGGRAQRRHRFSTADRASKAAWRFASRRSPIFFGCGLAALGLCVKVRPDSTALFRLRCLKKLNAFCGAKFAFRELREMKKKPREMPWAAFLKNKLAGRGGTAATEIETTGTAANENQAESAEGVGDRFGDSG